MAYHNSPLDGIQKPRPPLISRTSRSQYLVLVEIWLYTHRSVCSMERNHVDPLFIEPDQIIGGLNLLDGHMASRKLIWGKTH